MAGAIGSPSACNNRVFIQFNAAGLTPWPAAELVGARTYLVIDRVASCDVTDVIMKHKSTAEILIGIMNYACDLRSIKVQFIMRTRTQLARLDTRY